MMLRIREAECTQMIGDLRQRIAELEVQVEKRTISEWRSIDVDLLESRIDYPWSNLR